MRKHLALIVAVIVGVPLAPATPASAVSYPLTCKLGPGNAVTYAAAAGFTIAFSRTNGPASSGLQPAECAFEDRAVKSSEPGAICLPGVVIAIGFQGGRATNAGTAFSGPGAGFLKSAIFGPGTLVNFTVHNAGTCLMVDSVGV